MWAVSNSPGVRTSCTRGGVDDAIISRKSTESMTAAVGGVTDLTFQFNPAGGHRRSLGYRRGY